MADHYPQRIVCMTEEPTEVLYALGEEHRIVGISGFTVRPSRARKEKPKVSAFTSAKIGEILKLRTGPGDRLLRYPGRHRARPDQGRRGSVDQQPPQRGRHPCVYSPARCDGGRGRQGRRLCAAGGTAYRRDPSGGGRSSRVGRQVYFEEWDEPLITGIRWVAELVRIAGGDDVFPRDGGRVAGQASHPGQISGEVVRQAPDIILGSWCGKRFRPERVAARDRLGRDSGSSQRRSL